MPTNEIKNHSNEPTVKTQLTNTIWFLWKRRARLAVMVCAGATLVPILISERPARGIGVPANDVIRSRDITLSVGIPRRL